MAKSVPLKGARRATNRRWLIVKGWAFEGTSPVCRTDYATRLCNCMEGRLQEFRIFMQFLCRRAYALAPVKQV